MSRDIALPQPWKALAARHGGSLNLAKKLCVAHSSLWRWAQGLSSPRPGHQAILSAMFADASLPLPIYRTLAHER
jgi:hypothetical protein